MSRHHPLVQAAIRNFVTYNPMFLFSALLLLGGAWLVNPPRADGGRDRLMLLQLFGGVQLYELALLGAAALLAWRGRTTSIGEAAWVAEGGRHRRDVRFLSLVLAPFLMDISCTNAVTAEQTGTWLGHGLALAALLAVVAGKAWVASRLTGIRFTPSAWAALLAGPLAVMAAPLAASFLAHHGFEADEQALAAGLVVAGLVTLWGAADAHDARDAFAFRALSPIVLGVAAWHALGTAWAHTGSALYVVGPALIALGHALPRLAWPHLAARDAWTPLLLPVAGALLCGWPGLSGAEPWIGGSAWQLGLIGLAAAHALGFARHRTLPFLLGVLVACDLAAAGGTLSESLRHVGRGPAEPLALVALFAYGLWKRAHPVLLFTPLVTAAFLVARLRLLGSGAVSAGLAVDLFAAGLLAWTHLTHGRRAEGAAWRFVGCTLLWLPAYVAAARGGVHADAAAVAGRATLVALLGLAAFTRLRGYAVPGLLLPLEGARAVAPASAAGWGALGIGGAFAAVGLGVLVSLKREALLAWLEREDDRDAEPDEVAPAAPPTPIAVGGPVSSRSGVVVGSVLAALLVPLVLFAAGHSKLDHRVVNEAAAIGALRTIQAAQSVYRERHDGRTHARSLEALGDLLDPVLATGTKYGYRFEVLVNHQHPGFLWMATATPVYPEYGARSFATNHSGEVAFSQTPIPLDRECRLPPRYLGR